MINKMNFKERALLMAKLSKIAYMDETAAKKEARKLGFTTIEFYNRDGAQAYRFMNKQDLVIACRGTQPTQWNDIKADLQALPVMAETISRVHRGFKAEVDDLWPMIQEDLERSVNKPKTLWFTGHSLGAAMATIMASRCHKLVSVNPVECLYTFGSPRVGWPKYCQSLEVKHHRFVNNNDIVTRVPLTIMGYRHHGTENYFNAYGKYRSPTGWQRIKDRLRGIWMGWRAGKIDSFSDHNIGEYIRHIENM